MSKKAKIGLIQLKISNNNKKNIENSIKKIRLAAKKKAILLFIDILQLRNRWISDRNRNPN